MLQHKGKLLATLAVALFSLSGVSAQAADNFTPTTDFIDNGNGTVTHDLTGLIWMRCAMGQIWTGATCDGTARAYTFDEAKALTPNFAGRSDWRLPSPWELATIVDYDTHFPAINTSIFPNTPSSLFWSNLPLVSDPTYSWSILFNDGMVHYNFHLGDGSVRLVRDGQSLGSMTTPTADFTDNGDGTVTHKKTGLTWKRCPEGYSWIGATCSGTWSTYTWDQAAVLTASFAGKSDWRIPNIQELLSIVEFGSSDPASNIAIFPNTQISNSYTWSGSPSANSNSAWGVYFTLGQGYTYQRGSIAWPVRLVRGVQSPASSAQANQSPNAAFIASALAGSAPLTVNLDAGGSTDSDGSIASYAWSTSTGQTATGRTASFTFSAEGSYTVTLTVTDNQGATAAAQKTIAVSAPPATTGDTITSTYTPTCSPSTLNLCISAVACVYEGNGYWCDNACRSTLCTYETERDQCAVYDPLQGRVDVKCVITDDAAYSARLSIVSEEPFRLAVTSLDTYPTTHVDPDCAEFDSESLTINMSCLNIGGTGYDVGLSLDSAEPILFGVNGVSPIGKIYSGVYKNIYINEFGSDPLYATFADVNDRQYALFAVKDSENQPVYYHRLATYTRNAYGDLDDYVTLDFDSAGRPISFSLYGGSQGVIAMEYLSDGVAEVTISADGQQETVRVINRFPGLSETPVRRRVPRDGRPYETYTELTYLGDIISCAVRDPKVTVKRNFNNILKSKYPVLARSFEADVFPNTYAESDADYAYRYKITVPGDNIDSWKRWCQIYGFLNNSVGFLGLWGGDKAGDFATGVIAGFRDAGDGVNSNSLRAVTDKALDLTTRGIPIISTARNWNDAWEIEGSGMNGPCSESVYHIKRRRLLHEQTITVNDETNDYIISQVYQPKMEWIYGADYVHSAPTFDFSQQCGVGSGSTVCDPDVVSKIHSSAECTGAGGAWQLIGGGPGYPSSGGRCFCW